jgi:hypothetical protein
MKKKISAVLALLVTVFFMALALRKVRLLDLEKALSSARWSWLLLMVGIAVLDIVIRAFRWKILLSKAAPRASFRELFRLEAIGLALNNVLFMRIGELARAMLAARSLGIASATALASVAVERALDVAALLILFCGAAQGNSMVDPRLKKLAFLTLLACISTLGVLAVAEQKLAPGGRWERRLGRFPRLHRLVLEMASGASVLRRPGAAFGAAGLSIFLWSVDALVYWAGARALSIGPLVSYARSILVLSWAGAASALPAAPGAFGTFEAFVQNILSRFGASPEIAFAYAILAHMSMYLIVTILGLVLLYTVGLSLAELESTVRRGHK